MSGVIAVVPEGAEPSDFREPSTIPLLVNLTSDTFSPLAQELITDDPLGFVDRYPYGERLDRLHEVDAFAEAIHVGFANIGRHKVAIVCSNYDFMAGSLGIAAAERIARMFVLATAAKRPVVSICRSAGTRMQEGTPAFVKMMSIAAAISEHREAGLPFLSYLLGPSMGGALASWGTQGQLVWAAPGATISLTGPRVAEFLTGNATAIEDLSAESQLDRGLIDEVVPLDNLATRAEQWLDLVHNVGTRDVGLRRESPAMDHPAAPIDAWESVVRSRAVDRAGIWDFVAATQGTFNEIRGDRAGTDDRGLIAGITSVAGTPVMMQGFARTSGRGSSVSPSGYRKALRVVRLADEMNLPIVSFIDTAGAGAGNAIEAQGLAHAIGDLMQQLLRVRVPTISVLTGEGSGAGAIGLLPADCIMALEYAWLTPIAPEAGSAILFRSTSEAPRLARGQHADAFSMRDDHLVDVVISETGSTSKVVASVMMEVRIALRSLLQVPPESRLLARRAATRSLSRHLLKPPAGLSATTIGE